MTTPPAPTELEAVASADHDSRFGPLLIRIDANRARGCGIRDVMLYDKASNTFAIARRDGAPRLYRKPLDGAATWDKAKSDAGNASGYRSQRRYHAPSAGDYRSASD